MTAIGVDRVTHRYGERTALDGVSFDVAEAEIFGLLGPNGGGKTTLFRIASTLLRPTEGSVFVLGADGTRDPMAVRRAIGVVFQAPSLDRKLTAAENLRHQGHLYGMSGAALRARAAEMLARVGLAERAGERVENLSGGLRRRVEVAKGLLHRPRVLLLDEPSTGLDPGARLDLWSHLGQIRAEEGTTSLVTTHLMEEAEKCDRLGLLDRGRLVAVGTPDELKGRLGGDIVTVRGSDPAGLAAAIAGSFGVRTTVLEGSVRFETADGAALLPRLIAALPGRIDALSVGRPTLEDVFVQLTGHRLWGGGGAA